VIVKGQCAGRSTDYVDFKIHPPLEGGSKLSSSDSEKRILERGLSMQHPAPKNSPARASEFFDPPSRGGWNDALRSELQSYGDMSYYSSYAPRERA
jgi:hypothetical protein